LGVPTPLADDPAEHRAVDLDFDSLATADGDSVNLDHTNQIVFVSNSAWSISDADRFLFETAPLRPPPRSARDLGRFYRELLAAGSGTWLHDARDDERDAPPTVPLRWVGADQAGSALDDLRRRVELTWRNSYRHRLPRAGAALAGAMGQIRHRIYFTDAAARRVFGIDIESHPFVVLLDLRFRYLLGHLQLHLSASVWNFTPRHPYHLPPGIAEIPPPKTDLVQVRDTFADIATRVEAFFARHLVPTELSVHLRHFTLPQFWVAASMPRRADPAEYLELDAGRTRRLVRTFLRSRDPRGTVASRSVIDGCLLTLRRVRRVDQRVGEDQYVESDVPTYLILPSSGLGESPRSDAETELATANAITALSDLEAETAARLFEVEAELDICRNHMAMYNAAAERAGFLLDALSTHLLIRRGRQLDKAHRQVDLLHQTLLQAVADLAHVTVLIRARASEIFDAAQAVRDDFDDKATEFVPWPGVQGVRAALTETGLFEAANRSAQDRLAEADRVKNNFDDLLRAIASAFDERRVREFDQIQKASALLAVALGALSIVTVFNYNNPVPNFPSFVPDGLALTTGAWVNLIAVVSVVVGLIWFLRVLRVGRLGSASFRDEYDGRDRARRQALQGRSPTDPSRPVGWSRHTRVWQIMLETSTDNLDRLVARGNNDNGSDGPVDWDRLDIEFAASFANIWDRRRRDDGLVSARTQASEEAQTRRHFTSDTDIEHIGYQIEQWAVQALLFTERARRMYRYRLPVLTCLYRCCGLIRDSFLKLSYVSPENMVADVDFYRCLALLGFTATETQLIDEWLRLDANAPDGLRDFPSAGVALRHVRSLGLSSTMDASARQSTMDIASDRPMVPRPRPAEDAPVHAR
jgi:hypothetical protein